MVEYLPSKCKAMSSNSSTTKQRERRKSISSTLNMLVLKGADQDASFTVDLLWTHYTQCEMTKNVIGHKKNSNLQMATFMVLLMIIMWSVNNYYLILAISL
jgi:hypothetical protein